MSLTTDPAFPRNLRLAIVMNGGVSLAVWMSGATHELNNCRLAADAAEDSPSRSVWHKLLNAANTQVTIDMIAGASAGGLNGTVLAKAIAMQEDLPDMKTLWFDRAAVSAGKLLALRPTPAASLLDGTYLHDQVRDLLSTAGRPVLASGPPTMTLLVTATALPIADEGDDIPEVVPDSRRVYQFVAEPGVPTGTPGIPDSLMVPARNDFVDVGTLACAARASAAFPTAFQPVRETDELRQRRKGQEAARGRWLMDGGVLDNAPFEPLLDELRRRAVSDRFSRAVVYVNPSAPPVSKKHFAAADPASAPGILTTLSAFVSATREPDRRLDVEGLNDALKVIGYTATDPDTVLAEVFEPEASGALTTETLRAAAAGLLEQYRSNRRQHLVLTAMPAPAMTVPPRPTEAAMAAAASDLLVPAVRGLLTGTDWHWGLAAASRVLRWWGRAMAKREPSDRQRTAFAALAPAQRLVQSWADEFDLEIRPGGDITHWIAAAEGFLTSRNIPSLLAELMRTTAAKIAPVLDAGSAEALLDASLDLEVINRALSWRSDSAVDVPKFDFWQITPAAVPPFDLQLSRDKEEQWPTKKLYGERWGHFGAFASEEGRKWDWLWGRLDAAMTLSGKILNDTDLGEEQIKSLQAELIAAICAEEGRGEPELVSACATMFELSQAALWRSYRGAASKHTRTALRKLANALPGAAVPASWPAPLHAVVDTRQTWKQHGPRDATARRKVRLYRTLGVIAQIVARRKVARLVRPEPAQGSVRSG